MGWRTILTCCFDQLKILGCIWSRRNPHGNTAFRLDEERIFNAHSGNEDISDQCVEPRVNLSGWVVLSCQRRCVLHI